MKTKKTFVYCENCNKAYEDVSPPTAAQYKQGFITISEYSTLLLCTRKKGPVHVKNLDGHYCDSECLASFIAKAKKEGR